MLELIGAALLLWGWNGMHVDIQYTDLGWGVRAQAVPSEDTEHRMTFSRCVLTVNTYYPTDPSPLVILHEIGHCVGYVPPEPGLSPHSEDPASVMYVGNEPAAERGITVADRLHVKLIRDKFLRHRVIVPGWAKQP